MFLYKGVGCLEKTDCSEAKTGRCSYLEYILKYHPVGQPTQQYPLL